MPTLGPGRVNGALYAFCGECEEKLPSIQQFSESVGRDRHL